GRAPDATARDDDQPELDRAQLMVDVVQRGDHLDGGAIGVELRDQEADVLALVVRVEEELAALAGGDKLRLGNPGEKRRHLAETALRAVRRTLRVDDLERVRERQLAEVEDGLLRPDLRLQTEGGRT